MKKFVDSSQKGAISVFVMIAMVFFLISIMGIYMISSKRAQAQTEAVKLAQNKYYANNEENQIYQEKIAQNTEPIPIYTKEQVWSIGSGVAIQIEGKVYTFADGATYELKNDIVINIEDFRQIDNTKITKNQYEIYYYFEGNYYLPTSDEVADLSINGNRFKHYNV